MKKLYTLQDVENLDINEIHTLYKKFVNNTRVELLSSFGFGNDIVDHAEGMYIYLRSGQLIYDFTGGIGVLNHGHNHPRILAARKNFCEKSKMEVHKNFFSPYIAALSHNIAKLLPGELNKSFFPNSGAEAIDAAMRTAYKYHDLKREHILYSDIAFHGKLLGPSSITLSPENEYPYPKIQKTSSYKFNDIESVKEAINALARGGKCNIAAIFCEPYSVSTMQSCSKEFLFELRDLCSQNDILLVFDEVYSGWCKTGNLFYFMNFQGLVPDILCMGKSFGGGKASISGIVIDDRVYKKTFDNPQSANLLMSTYYGFGEETATAIESINIIIEDDYIGKSKSNEAYMRPRFETLQAKFSGQIKGFSGSGSIFGIFLNSGPEILGKIISMIPINLFQDKLFLKKLVAASVVSRLYDKHQILSFTSFANNTHVIISPPIIAKKEDIDYLFLALNEVFEYGIISCVRDFAKRKYL
jgi:putrescine aminotransferase